MTGLLGELKVHSAPRTAKVSEINMIISLVNVNSMSVFRMRATTTITKKGGEGYLCCSIPLHHQRKNRYLDAPVIL